MSFKVIKIPASVHGALKLHCVKTGTPMWMLAGKAINEKIFSKEEQERAKSKSTKK